MQGARVLAASLTTTGLREAHMHRKLLFALAGSALTGAAYAKTAPLVITYDHATKTQSVGGIAERAVGEPVELKVINTNLDCFDYNGAPKMVPASGAGLSAPRDQLTISLVQQRRSNGYTMKITKKLNPPAACAALPLEEWETSTDVETLGWEVSFSGAFAFDGLRDRAYFLEDANVGGVDGFIVNRDRDAESQTNQRPAVMIHLYNSGWDAKRSISWAPVTFGFSVDDNSRYMLGTSAKFGDKLYVTAGGVVGKVKVLPVGLVEGGFTTEQNAITTLGTKSEVSWFLSFSYSVLGTGAKDQFTGIFGKTAPQP
jgi:hypothetical protein